MAMAAAAAATATATATATALLLPAHKLPKNSPKTPPKLSAEPHLPFPQPLPLLSPPIPLRRARIRGARPRRASPSSAAQTPDSECAAAAPPPSQNSKLFVGNLPFDCGGEKLLELFSRAGAVESAEVIYDLQTDKSRGFGFVTMSDLEGSERAVDMLDQYELDGRQITVNKATPRGSKPVRSSSSGTNTSPSHKIYVGNLPWQIDDAQLERIFGEHGKVIDARVVYEKESGRSRGFGFVRIAIENSVDDVISALDGKNLDGRIIRVDLAEQRE